MTQDYAGAVEREIADVAPSVDVVAIADSALTDARAKYERAWWLPGTVISSSEMDALLASLSLAISDLDVARRVGRKLADAISAGD